MLTFAVENIYYILPKFSKHVVVKRLSNYHHIADNFIMLSGSFFSVAFKGIIISLAIYLEITFDRHKKISFKS